MVHHLKIVNASSTDMAIELKPSRYVSFSEVGIHLPPISLS